jgi:hypothetical protein
MDLAPPCEDVWRSGGIVQRFLNIGKDGDEWSASRADRFTSCSYWVGGSVGPRVSLDAAQIGNFSFTYRDSKPNSSVIMLLGYKTYSSPCAYAPPYENVCGSGGMVPCILNLGTGWRWSAARVGRFNSVLSG